MEREITITTGPLGWGWVRLEQLADIIGYTVEETWERFSALSREEDLEWSPDLSELVQIPHWREPDYYENIYVPAGWAKDVLKVVGMGGSRAKPDWVVWNDVFAAVYNDCGEWLFDFASGKIFRRGEEGY